VTEDIVVKGVEQISISCELITASAQGDKWRELILKVSVF